MLFSIRMPGSRQTLPGRVDVVVVGAGLAGLATARALIDAGKSVVVLEARDRVGGRTWTKRVGRGVFDVGGQWIGPGQTRVAALAEELGVRTFPTFTRGKKVLDLDGELSEYRSAIPQVSVLSLIQLQAGLALIDRAQRTVSPDAPWSAHDAASFDAQTLESWRTKMMMSRTVGGMMDAAVRTIFGAEASELSLLFFLSTLSAGGGLMRLAQAEGGAQQDRFVEGAQSISMRLSEKLGDTTVLGAPVRHIADDGKEVTVTSDQGTIRCGRIVVAVPPTLAGRIEHAPALPTARDQLTQRYGMGATVKVLCLYDAPFWRDRGYSGEIVSSVGPLSIVYDNGSHDDAQAALLGFVVGKHARAFSALSETQRRDRVEEQLVRYFGIEAAAIRAFETLDWSAEPWTRGCPVGVLGPGVLTQLGPALRASVGRVHFAGTETATEWTGYMEGALESAERVVREVLSGGRP
jgi:monoamine oxidase